MCAAGHVLHGVHVTGSGLYTCQHKEAGKSCGRHVYAVPFLNRCITVDLTKDEFDIARQSNRLSDQLEQDLQHLVEGWVLSQFRSRPATATRTGA